MEFLFNTVGLVVPKRTRDKFVLVGAGKTRSALLEFVDPDQLPPCYGGFPLGKKEEPIQEILVAARQSHRIETPVLKGNTIKWDFMTKTNDVGVSFGMIESSGSTKGLCEMVKEESGQGSLIAQDSGLFCIAFDNEYSLMTDKTILLRLVIE